MSSHWIQFMDAIPTYHSQLLDQLVAESVISRERAEAVKRRQRAEWVPLGQILRKEGHLTMRQLLKLLDLQAGSPTQQIGALAVREGLCSPSDVEAALAIQRKASPHLFELLAEDGACDHARLFAFVVRYVRQLESKSSEFAR